MKAKSKTKIYSRDVHISVPQSSSPKFSTISKFISLGIIIISMVLVVLALLLAIFNRPENVIKAKIDSLARDYYENYIYEEFVNSDAYAEITDLEAVMQKYVKRGFSRVALRQILLHDPDKYANDAAYLREYCNENSTFIQIFPESPFTRTAYHMEITYSCNF